VVAPMTTRDRWRATTGAGTPGEGADPELWEEECSAGPAGEVRTGPTSAPGGEESNGAPPDFEPLRVAAWLVDRHGTAEGSR